MRAWYEANKDAVLLKEKGRLNTPEGKARRVVIDAVRRGRIHKPDRCEACGIKPGKMRLHAHHADYSKPLDVEWLCGFCHAARHRADTLPEAICKAAREALSAESEVASDE